MHKYSHFLTSLLTHLTNVSTKVDTLVDVYAKQFNMVSVYDNLAVYVYVETLTVHVHVPRVNDQCLKLFPVR